MEKVPADTDPGRTAPAHLLHVEIRCNTESDAVVRDMARSLRTGLTHWTRQLLFESDPVQKHQSAQNSDYVVIMEFDSRHTAETIASSLDTVPLQPALETHAASYLVRILSLEGSATYHKATPCVPVELPIDNRTHREVVSDRKRPDSKLSEPSYFGIKPNQYVHH
jgi:hypothetical protein